jgi:hypothetical protein
MIDENKENIVPVSIEYPADKIPLARYNVAIDAAKRAEDGLWEVTRTVKQIVTFDNKLWFVREKTIKAIDKSFAKANKTTHKAIGSILSACQDDFFSKPGWDGNQYVMTSESKDDVLIEEHHGTVKNI